MTTPKVTVKYKQFKYDLPFTVSAQIDQDAGKDILRNEAVSFESSNCFALIEIFRSDEYTFSRCINVDELSALNASCFVRNCDESLVKTKVSVDIIFAVGDKSLLL